MAGNRRNWLLLVALFGVVQAAIWIPLLWWAEYDAVMTFIGEDIVGTYAFGYLMVYGAAALTVMFVIGIAIMAYDAVATRVRRYRGTDWRRYDEPE